MVLMCIQDLNGNAYKASNMYVGPYTRVHYQFINNKSNQTDSEWVNDLNYIKYSSLNKLTQLVVLFFTKDIDY